MNTSERLKAQKRSLAHAGSLLGVGFVLGLGLGLVAAGDDSGGSAFGWVLFLIAFGLGIVSVLATWWLLGIETTRKEKLEG